MGKGAKMRMVSIIGVALAGVFCAALADDLAWEREREALKNKERPLIFNSDGNELIYYPTNAPITVGGFTSQRLAKYIGSRISTLIYCPWSSGFGLMSTTRAGEFFDRPINLVQGCTNAAPAFAAQGLDCLDMTVAFCRTNGMEVFVSLRVNDTHDASYLRAETKRSWLFPKWKEENPDCLFGTVKDRPKFGAWTAVDFENPKTRERMKEFVSEFVNNYDIDGIEYDFMRHGPLLKSVGQGAYATDAQLKMMTEFMMELRAITEAAGRKKGKPLLVLVRTADSLGYVKGIGIDIEAWLKAGVMDMWSVSDYFQLDYLKSNAALAHKYGVKFYSALAESRVGNQVKRLKKQGKNARMLPGRNSISSFAAEYAAAQVAGCDGVALFNLSCIWNAVNAPKLLKVDPRGTTHLNKTYFALVRGSGGYLPEMWLKNGDRFYRRSRIDPGHPLSVPTDKPFVFRMELGAENRAVASVSVKAMFAGERQVVKALSLNGKQLALESFADGVHTYACDANDLKTGFNLFAVDLDPTCGDTVSFEDFALYITPPRIDLATIPARLKGK